MSQNKKAEKELEEALKNGYKEMADINLELAQICFEADDDCLKRYEEKLTECE